MNINNELFSLIKNEKILDLEIFLKKLDKDQRAIISQEIKNRHYIFKFEGSLNAIQHKMILISRFVCLDNKTAGKIKDFFDLGLCYNDSDVLEKYCPEWFSDFINRTVVSGSLMNVFPHITYDQMLDWTYKGFLIPSSDLIARTLSKLIYERDYDSVYAGDGKIIHYFTPEYLLDYTITLEEHIWCLFNSHTDINKRNSFIWLKNADNEKANWLEVFKQFSNEGKINRERILVESLSATTRNLNRTLKNWFVKLFNEMQPTTNELLNLQYELFWSLNSQNSSAVNNGLKKIAEIIDHEFFDKDNFKRYVPILLSSPIKSVVKKTQILADKLQ